MKRLPLIWAAAAVLTVSPLAADLASAQGRGEGRGRSEDSRGRGRGDDGPRYERRGPPEGRGYDRRGDDRRNEGRRNEGRRDDRRDDRREYQRRDDGPPRVRPGGRLPPQYDAPQVRDYPRYRLRPPPAGYAWRRAEGAFVLTDRDGRVYDVIPD